MVVVLASLCQRQFFSSLLTIDMCTFFKAESQS